MVKEEEAEDLGGHGKGRIENWEGNNAIALHAEESSSYNLPCEAYRQCKSMISQHSTPDPVSSDAGGAWRQREPDSECSPLHTVLR